MFGFLFELFFQTTRYLINWSVREIVEFHNDQIYCCCVAQVKSNDNHQLIWVYHLIAETSDIKQTCLVSST